MNIKRAKLVSEYRLAPKLAVPLQTISLLAAVVFVASFTHEVLDTNNLWAPRKIALSSSVGSASFRSGNESHSEQP